MEANQASFSSCADVSCPVSRLDTGSNLQSKGSIGMIPQTLTPVRPALKPNVCCINERPWACERVGRSHERVLVNAHQRKVYRAANRWECDVMESCVGNRNVASPVSSPRGDRSMNTLCDDLARLNSLPQDV
mmetsp:Transcript_19741/g.33846  ORF Transcript_19741/g.33846 Transcript_19741/m.33846 type:complete len:132 (+) Transcript_19741:76-471(+)